jgi:hypothetical protein
LLWEDVLSRKAQSATARKSNAAGPLADDLASLDRLVSMGEWKAAALVGGGIMEVLLVAMAQSVRGAFDAHCRLELEKSNSKRDDGAHWNQPPAKIGMYGLIAALFGSGCMSAKDAALCHAARKVRNAIHGGAVTDAEARHVADAVALLLPTQAPKAAPATKTWTRPTLTA